MLAGCCLFVCLFVIMADWILHGNTGRFECGATNTWLLEQPSPGFSFQLFVALLLTAAVLQKHRGIHFLPHNDVFEHCWGSVNTDCRFWSALPNLFPRREAGDVWCLPPVWNLRAVIWFHFAIAFFVLLPSPVTLSILPFSACWSFLLNFFQKILQYFSLRDRLICMTPV